jgi:ribonuclease HI
MLFTASNITFEYETLLHGHRITKILNIRRMKILGDSLPVINKGNKEWSCINEKTMLYCQELLKLENNFDGLEYHHVLHGQNEVDDELAKFSSSLAMVPSRLLYARAPRAKH